MNKQSITSIFLLFFFFPFISCVAGIKEPIGANTNSKEHRKEKKRFICGYSLDKDVPYYEAKIFMLLLCDQSKYDPALKKEVNSIDKAQAVTKNKAKKEFYRKMINLNNSSDDKNKDIRNLVEQALSLQRIYAEYYDGNFLSPAACQAIYENKSEINQEILFEELVLNAEIHHEERPYSKPIGISKEDRRPLNLNHQPTSTDNSAVFKIGAGYQEKIIDAIVKRKDAKSEDEVKNNTTQATSIECFGKNTSQNTNQPNHPTDETVKLDEAPKDEDMYYIGTDGTRFLASSVEKLEISQLGSNSRIVGFKRCDNTDNPKGVNPSSYNSAASLINQKTTSDPSLNSTAIRQRLDYYATSAASQSGLHNDTKQPTSERRKEDREKSLRRLNK